MIIIGRNNDDKGTQLENLTRFLLQDLSFRNITRNYVSSGGEEIDVRGEWVMPNVGEEQLGILICECKAQRAAVDITQWLKFLGKLYEEEAMHGTKVLGCFVALSNVNGNVAGSYTQLRTRHQKVSLVAGERLMELASRRYNLCNIHAVNETLRRYTTRQFRDTDIVYYHNHLNWIVYFEDDSYTLLSNDGAPLEEAAAQVLIPLLEASGPTGNYLNLKLELEAQNRKNVLRNYILSQVIQSGGEVTRAELSAPLEDATPEELDQVTADLIENGSIVIIAEGVISLPTQEAIFNQIVVDIFSKMLTGALFVDVLGCDYYDELVETVLIEHIQHTQGDLPLTPEEKVKALQLLRLSPTALVQMLQPDQMLDSHREDRNREDITDLEQRQQFADMINSHDIGYFFRILTNCLINDFAKPELQPYYYNKRGLREIDIAQATKVKSRTEITFEHETRTRYGLAEVVPELGGGILAVSMLTDAPQPWEVYQAATPVEVTIPTTSTTDEEEA